MPLQKAFTRREQQVMDAIHELGEATAKEVQNHMPDAPSYSAVRAVLGRLVEQDHLKFRESGPRYVYAPAEGKTRARQAALRKVVDIFFGGSPLHTMNALLGISAEELSREELEELARKIAEVADKTR